MIKVMVIEDDPGERDICLSMTGDYFRENKTDYEISLFSSAEEFFSAYHPGAADILLLDINLGSGSEGIDISKKVYEQDKNVSIIFVTSMMQFALSGYGVNAVAYIVKPVDRERFNCALKKAVMYYERSHPVNLQINTPDKMVCVNCADITYIEILSHKLVYHTKNDIYEEWNKSLTETESLLKKYCFSRCSRSYLINLRYASNIKDDYIIIYNDSIKVSDKYRASFFGDLNQFYMK